MTGAAQFIRYQQPEALPRRLVCAELSPMQKMLLQSSWWARDYKGRLPLNLQQQQHRPLILSILRFGGNEVCMPDEEPDLDALLTDGEFLYGELAKLVPMRQSECHANSSALWRASPAALQIMTGYALSVDGMWRQHTWCLEANTGRPVETTTARLGYFGIVLSAEEAKAFSLSNTYLDNTGVDA